MVDEFICSAGNVASYCGMSVTWYTRNVHLTVYSVTSEMTKTCFWYLLFCIFLCVLELKKRFNHYIMKYVWTVDNDLL